jgi:hypothetical protein
MADALAGSTPSAMLKIVRCHFESMSVLTTDHQLRLGGDVLFGVQSAAAPLDDRLHASEKFILGRARVPATVCASMFEQALRALSSRDVARRQVAVFARLTREESIDTKLQRFVTRAWQRGEIEIFHPSAEGPDERELTT